MEKIDGFQDRFKIRLANFDKLADFGERLNAILHDLVKNLFTFSDSEIKMYSIKFGLDCNDFTGKIFC